MDNDTHEWKMVKTIDGKETRYAVNRAGDVYDSRMDRIINPCVLEGGYRYLHVGDKLEGLHRVVYRTFNDTDIKGLDIHHKDGKPWNNAVNNLEALTRREHAIIGNIEHGKYLSEDIVRGVCEDIVANKLSPMEIVEKYEIPMTSFYNIKRKRSYPEITKDYDFSNYKYEFGKTMNLLSDKEWRKLINLVEQGVPNDIRISWLVDTIGIDREKAYYFSAEAKKRLKKMKEGKIKNDRNVYQQYHLKIDSMLIDGVPYKEIYEYLEKNTSFDPIDIRNLIHRRTSHMVKLSERIFNDKDD